MMETGSTLFPVTGEELGFRLTKAHRLLKAGEYSQVFNQTELRVSNRFMLLLAKSTQKEYSRIGLVISKKNVGCSVARNRIKRLCRETFRHKNQIFSSIDVVVLAKPGISKLDNKEILVLIDKLFAELKQKQLKTCPENRSRI